MIRIRDVVASYHTPRGRVTAVDGVTLDLGEHGIVGLAGESGSGKTTLMRVVYGDLAPPLALDRGRIEYAFDGDSGGGVTMENVHSQWFRTVSYIPQSSMSSLNPVRRIKHHFTDFLNLRSRPAREEVLAKALDFVKTLGLPPKVLESYPHQLSGGMRQRVMIALAFFLKPRLIIADEPTSALDVVVQKGILMMLTGMQRQMGNTILFVSHDMGVHYQIADRIAIMYAGKIVEFAAASVVFGRPSHPYTRMLIDSLPRIGDRGTRAGVEGRPPALRDMPPGCRFAARCPRADGACVAQEPLLVESEPGHLHACHHPYV
jgi:peptide/nickel transport system ATP-binding protein